MAQVPTLPAVDIIKVSYLGPTDTKGSRVKMTSTRFSDSVVISYNYEHNSARDIALDWLLQHGAKPTAQGWEDSSGLSFIILKPTSDGFKSMKEYKKQ